MRVVRELKVTASQNLTDHSRGVVDAGEGHQPYRDRIRQSTHRRTPAIAATPAPAKPTAAKPPPGKSGTRALDIDQVELLGPPAPPLTESHKRIFTTKPGPDLSKHDAARDIIEHFATRAFRHPVSKRWAKWSGYWRCSIWQTSKGETFSGAVRVALEGVLISPYFLYRMEQDIPDKQGVRLLQSAIGTSHPACPTLLWSSNARR